MTTETQKQKSTQQVAAKRPIVERFVMWLFRCPTDRKLISVWRTKDEVQALGQVITTTTIRIGVYKILAWTTVFTPVADWKK